jgi:hypothetical protein
MNDPATAPTVAGPKTRFTSLVTHTSAEDTVQHTVREQAATRCVTTRSIVASRAFARGFDEVRRGLPFNPDIDEWNYERGRSFGFIAPLDMPLRIGGRLNPKAVRLAEAAFNRKLLL